MIKCCYNREACFVYHMLSVSFCGYNNDYGQRHAALHDKQQLDVLKHHELLITVKGGVHIGELYWPFLAGAAASITPVDIYFRRFVADSGARGEIARVMVENYDIYIEKVWPQARTEIAPYVSDVQNALGNNIAVGLDGLFRGQSPGDFHPIFVNSIDGGADAIDVSTNQHIFGIGRSVEWAVKIISHEYIIFRLKTALSETDAFTDLTKYWLYIESLAAHYYEQFYKDDEHPFINKHSRHIVEFYKQAKGELSAAQLFELAVTQLH